MRPDGPLWVAVSCHRRLPAVRSSRRAACDDRAPGRLHSAGTTQFHRPAAVAALALASLAVWPRPTRYKATPQSPVPGSPPAASFSAASRKARGPRRPPPIRSRSNIEASSPTRGSSTTPTSATARHVSAHRVIPCWTEGLQFIKVGGRARLTLIRRDHVWRARRRGRPDSSECHPALRSWNCWRSTRSRPGLEARARMQSHK
jgi:hypothetical protein